MAGSVGRGDATEHLEVESTFEVDQIWALPDLAAVPGVSAVETATLDLDALYLDTADLHLLRGRATLRRRTGGQDAGWHLKLPAGSDRLELRRPAGESDRAVPGDLLDLTLARRRGADLVPVVRLTTHRSAHRLAGADGRVLVEVAVDDVRAFLLSPGGDDVGVTSWREVEAELVEPDGRGMLQDVEEVLLDSGARVSRWRSKLARALDPRLRELAPAPDRLRRGSPAVDVVAAYLAAQVEQLVAYDAAVRRDEDDAVHKMRVATRRLRSALATYRPLLDATRSEPVRGELSWLAGLLGVARDAEVLRERLLALARAEPPELLLGPVVARIDTDLGRAYRDGYTEVLDALSDPRYLRLLADLDRLVADRPASDRGLAPARDELPRLVGRDWRRLRRRVRHAAAGTGRYGLHDARKAAKRARYAAEAAATVLGSRASRFAAAMEQVQEVLGEHQDALAAQDTLRRIGVQAHLDGENGFSFGRLHALEQWRAARAAEAFDAVWARSSRSKLRAWL